MVATLLLSYLRTTSSISETPAALFILANASSYMFSLSSSSSASSLSSSRSSMLLLLGSLVAICTGRHGHSANLCHPLIVCVTDRLPARALGALLATEHVSLHRVEVVLTVLGQPPGGDGWDGIGRRNGLCHTKYTWITQKYSFVTQNVQFYVFNSVCVLRDFTSKVWTLRAVHSKDKCETGHFMLTETTKQIYGTTLVLVNANKHNITS